MKKYENSKKIRVIVKKIVESYIDGMSNYLFPDKEENKNEEKTKSPKFKNDRDRMFFK